MTDATKTSDDVPRLDFGEFFGRVLHSAKEAEIALSEMADLPPTGVPRHTHDHAHFCLVISGRYQTATRNFTGHCDHSALLYHPAGATHEDRFLGPSGRSLMISLGPDLVDAFGDPPLSRHSITLDDAEIGFPGSRVRNELRAPDRLSMLSVEGLVLEMIGRVLARAVPPDKRRPAWLTRAVAFLRESATDPTRVVDVANAVGVHPVHLARVFRRHLGLSPGEYLRRARVLTAMRLIERTTEPLTTVAIRTGFCDHSELTKAFRRELDTTPGAYRRAVRR